LPFESPVGGYRQNEVCQWTLRCHWQPGEIEVSLKGGEKELKEFTKDISTVGNISKCFVLTVPGDIISVDITAEAHTANVFDLEVDGILRASVSSNTLAKNFHGTINKVCFGGIKHESGKRNKAKYCAMKVQKRDASRGKYSSLSSFTVNQIGNVLRCNFLVQMEIHQL
jgi:hypothetical protein